MKPAAFIGRTETVSETVTPQTVRRWRAAAGLNPGEGADAGGALAAGGHWACFRPAPADDDLLEDGHSEPGGLIPVDPAYPRRMWAGGALKFSAPLRVGCAARRVSTVESVSEKQGRSGALLLIAVRHIIENENGETLIDERQDIIRRAPAIADKRRSAAAGGASAAAAPSSPAAPHSPAWRETVSAGPVRLFRYSAATFNGHRIHYDRRYAREVENYPGLVVHGPLVATWLMHFAERRAGRALASFSYRAEAPLFDEETVTLGGGPAPGRAGADAELSAAGADGRLAMRAEAVFARP